MRILAGCLPKKCAYHKCKNLVPEGKGFTKFCSRRCSNYAATKAMRDRRKVVLPMKNCELCTDEFQPTRSWQRFCHRQCTVVSQNNYGRRNKASNPDRVGVKHSVDGGHCNPESPGQLPSG